MLPTVKPDSASPQPSLWRHGRSGRCYRICFSVYLVITGALGGMFIGLSLTALQQPSAVAPAMRPPIISLIGGAEPTRTIAGVNFQEFWQVWDYVKENYVQGNVSDRELFYGSLRGMVDAVGDPYSVFLEPTTSAEFQQDLSGSFEGIGAEIGLRNSAITIIAPLPGNPAERAGLRAGDVIMTINGESTAGMPLDAAVQRIRGPRGTRVTLTIGRDAEVTPRKYTVVRETIEVVSVTWQALANNIAYIQLKSFSEDTEERFRLAAEQIMRSKPRGVILDLRNNPGGFLTTAIEVASYWTGPDRVVVSEQQRNRQPVGHESTNPTALFEGIPTVVLINGGSASASEIVAGALQDYQLAKLVGETSFGKGSVQDLHPLEDGSAVKLTIAKWLTPAGRQIDKTGIKPDIEVAPAAEDADPRQDPQLDKAIELLKSSPAKP
ncbi:MAG: S41 family peptidase [Patescibacteria group bacterium]|nr:S41 family peptidase [Patescibacteria group bacterium]